MYTDDKGNLYDIEDMVRNFETGEEFVIFTCIDDAFYPRYVLPKSRFDEFMTEKESKRKEEYLF